MFREFFSEDGTMAFAADFAASAKPGDIIALHGGLGAGKTVFARGFAQGLGYPGRVVSPTFTLVNEYHGGRFAIYHFDLYRLGADGADIESLGYEEYFHGDGICLIEWPDVSPEKIPARAVNITISADQSKGDCYRSIHIENPCT